MARVDRRTFLNAAAAAAATPFVSRSVLAGQQAGEGAAPVAIIGGGVAGLHAANLLRKAGRAVMVFEARPDPGGRVRTIRDVFADNQFAEAGAIRISGGHMRVLGLVKQHGLSIIPFSSSNGAELMTIGRSTVRSDELNRTPLPLDLRPAERALSQGALLEKYVGTLPRELSDPVPPTPDVWQRWAEYDRLTWPDWLRSRGASEAAVKLMTIGGDSRDLSALYVLRQYAMLRGKNQFYKIEGGMDRLPHAMADALGSDVQYGTAVTSIDHSGSTILVDYESNGESRRAAASHVIVTVPASLWGDIEFYPELSAQKQSIVREATYFPATRLLLQTYSRFWHASGLSGYARSDQPIEVWDSTYELPGKPGILAATVGGALGRRLLTMSPDAVVPYGRDLVAASLPGIQKEFQTGIAHIWANERWAKGAFSVYHPGQMTTMMPAMSAAEGRVHFAGEHTSSWMGWMEGALESGERAAREVLA